MSNIDFKHIKWGSLTKELKKFNKENNTNFDLNNFSNYIIKNQNHFKPISKKRAHFYLNVLNHSKLKGGKISVNHLQKFFSNSYSKKPEQNIDDYLLDESLTNDTAKVYHDPKTGHAVITHKGTQGASDWLNNAAYATGLYKYTNRYKQGQKSQKATEDKYGAKNVSTLGHSQGAVLSRHLGKNSKEIINLNPAYINEKPSQNEYNIKSSRDVVSALKPINSQDTKIKAESYNPLTEHSYDILERLNPDQMIGRGRKNHTLKDLKNKINQCILIDPNYNKIFNGAKTKKDILNRIHYIKNNL
jgi:translation initiation factor 2 beta subunit (eIF-2beta)/eIF-5